MAKLLKHLQFSGEYFGYHLNNVPRMYKVCLRTMSKIVIGKCHTSYISIRQMHPDVQDIFINSVSNFAPFHKFMAFVQMTCRNIYANHFHKLHASG